MVDKRKYTQSITYWAPSGENKYGEKSYAAPVLLVGRWENRAEQIRLGTGEEITSKAIVWIPQVVAIAGYLAEGDLTGISDPALASAEEIRTIISIPSMRTNQVERRAIL